MNAALRQPRVLIVSPALAQANNGNWQTASRWARLLRASHPTEVTGAWNGQPCDALIALHARRSAASVAAFSAAHPTHPCIVVLTGTDLYRDIRSDATAQASLQHASHLVVLQEQGLAALPAPLRHKARVIHPSVTPRQPAAPPQRALHAVWVGHLRAEKDPLTLLRAAARLAQRKDIRIDLIGAALEPALAVAVQAALRESPRLRWLGPRPHGETRARIQRAHVLINSSVMEGGAHVVMEAVQSGTAVLASRIDGNVGLLGATHTGLFALGDDAQLAALIERARDDPAFLAHLRGQGAGRSALFEPAAEQRALHELIASALADTTPQC